MRCHSFAKTNGAIPRSPWRYAVSLGVKGLLGGALPLEAFEVKIQSLISHAQFEKQVKETHP